MASAIKGLAALLLAWWLKLAVGVQLLLTLMAIDFATGVMVAMKRRKLCAHEAWKGLGKKVAVLIVVMVVYLLQRSIGTMEGIQVPIELGKWIAYFYVCSEAISILENCSRLGAPIPEPLRRTLARVSLVAEGKLDPPKAASGDRSTGASA